VLGAEEDLTVGSAAEGRDLVAAEHMAARGRYHVDMYSHIGMRTAVDGRRTARTEGALPRAALSACSVGEDAARAPDVDVRGELVAQAEERPLRGWQPERSLARASLHVRAKPIHAIDVVRVPMLRAIDRKLHPSVPKDRVLLAAKEQTARALDVLNRSQLLQLVHLLHLRALAIQPILALREGASVRLAIDCLPLARMPKERLLALALSVDRIGILALTLVQHGCPHALWQALVHVDPSPQSLSLARAGRE